MSPEGRSLRDMGVGSEGRPTGHVFRVERVRGPVWYAKYRLPDGRQVQKKLGPAWTGRGRPANGYFTKRTAEDWLGSVLDQARRGTLPGMVPTGATFADAAAEWLRYIEHDRARKPSTVAGYRSIVGSELLPRFGTMALEAVTPGEIEFWQASMTQAASTRTEALVLMHGIFERAQGVVAIIEPGGGRGEAAGDAQRRPAGVLSRGGMGTRPRGGVRGRRGAAPDRGLHRAADGGAARAALAPTM